MSGTSCRAIAKAESLAGFVRRRGAPLAEYRVALTSDEAFEFLDHLAQGKMGTYVHQELLIEDVRLAHVGGDPFRIACQFSLAGLGIAPAAALQ